jgi:hypothetical protein
MPRLVHQRIGTALLHAKSVVDTLSAVQDDDSDVKAQLAECVKVLRTIETATRPGVNRLSAAGAKFVLRQIHGLASAALRKVGV